MVKVRRERRTSSESGGTGQRPVPLDLHRGIVFPNRMRELRQRLGYPKLLPLAMRIPDVPYIRLSKIERGEVFARPDEIRRVAHALGLEPTDLLIDLAAPGFDFDAWVEPFRDGNSPDLTEERFAVLLAAALRARRAADPALTIATIDQDYGLPPVNLSRIENAVKPFGRWNAAIRRALFAIFDVADEPALRAQIEAQHRAGALDSAIGNVVDPIARMERTRARVQALAEELQSPVAGPAPAAAVPPSKLPLAAAARMLQVRGGPMPAGRIADAVTGDEVEAPSGVGPRAFALRVSRATLGAGLPVQSIVILDPDRSPTPGGLTALRDGDGWRLLSVGLTREGQVVGYSTNPELEISLDDCDRESLATVVSAIFP